MSEPKPSEALFVRSILPYCKRIGPLWMKNAALVRQEKREKNKKIKHRKHLKKMRKEGCISNEEVGLCVTLLRKLYREVKPHCLGDLMKAWISISSSSKNGNECIITRGDARGRMRRIDGGRGADKVWRLDVIVAILFHGLPLSSSDNGIITHSCRRELCVNPQHIRFRVPAVSVVLAMKVLAQHGYKIRKNSTSVDDIKNKRYDEYVDMCGPFSIDTLEKLKNEYVTIDKIDNCKLTSSSDDICILDRDEYLKKHYLKQLLLSNTASNIDSYRVSKKEIIAAKVRERQSGKNKCFQDTHSQNENSDLESQDTIPETEDKELIDILGCHDEKVLQSLQDSLKSRVWMGRINDSSASIDLDKNSEPYEKQHQVSERPDSVQCDNRNLSVENMREIPPLSRACSDKRFSTESKMFRDEEATTTEFFDMLYSMRNHYKPDSSLKITTPFLFSPTSDSDDTKAAED